MEFNFNHFNFNVKNLDESLKFYSEALGLTEVRRKASSDGDFVLAFLSDGSGSFSLELTWLRDHQQAYDLGECEFHLAVETPDMEAAFKKHSEMGCVCYENPDMGIYFINDPDGYWIEIIPKKQP